MHKRAFFLKPERAGQVTYLPVAVANPARVEDAVFYFFVRHVLPAEPEIRRAAFGKLLLQVYKRVRLKHLRKKNTKRPIEYFKRKRRRTMQGVWL
jgi:hypothetical protein